MTKFLNSKNRKVVETAVEILKKNGVLVMPTETAYGLGADATNGVAVQKIYKIKGRSFKKFLPLIASDLKQIKKYFKLNKKELELLKKYKGLTVILSLKHKSIKALKQNIYLLPGQGTCAVRISTNAVAGALAKKLGRPITATSANVSGGDNCYSVKEVLGQFKRYPSVSLRSAPLDSSPQRGEQEIDLILDGGKLKKRKPSTIVKVTGGKMEILRQGEIKISF